MELIQVIKDRIKQDGPISFASFMQMALYDPTDGYYTTHITNIGIKGDFVTAPQISSLFGFSIAKQVQQVMADLTNPVIVEFGAGTGKLCIDILTKLDELNVLPEAYYILDVSGNLKQIQQQAIQKAIPKLIDKVKWISTFPQEPLQGVIIGNEVLDAMPVNRFILQEGELLEIHVDINSKDELCEVLLPVANSQLKNYVAEFVSPNLNNYQSEANLFIDSWVSELYKFLERGAVFLIDYGFSAAEYYHPDRNIGTIMCHFQQIANHTPFLNIGKQDITAHVNFTHVAERAYECGFRIAGFTNQATFLLNNNILDLLQDVPESNLIQENQSLKTLLQPHEMGELFKVIALTKDLDIDLQGFKLNDKRGNL